METKRRILFVDEEQKVLNGLRRMLRPMRAEWDMEFVVGRQDALAMLRGAPFDVIVTDMRLPIMDGAQLLEECQKRYPWMVRIILSAQSDQEAIMRAIGPSHRYMSKPCEPKELRATVQRACSLREYCTSEALRAVVAKVETLPSLPQLIVRIQREAADPDASLERVGELIEQDIGMTAKILQLVNSAYFGLHEKVSTATRAVTLLGLERIKALVFSAQVFRELKAPKIPGFSPEGLQQHSLRVAAGAQEIVKRATRKRALCPEAFLAGMLHDSGKLVLATNETERYLEALAIAEDEGVPLWRAETRVFGVSHAAVGAYLMGLWGLPDPVIEAIAFHHQPCECAHQARGSLAAVHIADVLCRDEDEPAAELDGAYLAQLGLEDDLVDWRSELGQAA